MACKLSANCDLNFSLQNYNLPKHTKDMDLKVCTLWGKYRSTQVRKYSPWGTEVKPFPLLWKKMTEFLSQRQVITTHYTNMSYQPRPKATAIDMDLKVCTLWGIYT